MDKQDTARGLVDDFIGLDGRLAEILAHEVRPGRDLPSLGKELRDDGGDLGFVLRQASPSK